MFVQKAVNTAFAQVPRLLDTEGESMYDSVYRWMSKIISNSVAEYIIHPGVHKQWYSYSILAC